MRKLNKTLATLILALIGSTLFYKETSGINFLIFTLFSIIGLYSYNKNISINKFLLTISPTVICSITLLFYPQTLTYLTWLFCYLIMWGSIKRIFFPLLIPLQSIVSIIESPLHKIKNIQNKPKDESKTTYAKKYLGASLVTGLIVICFLLLYSNSNPIVGNLLSKIDISFIEFGFILKTLIIFSLLFGLVNYRNNEEVLNLNKMSTELIKTGLSRKVGKEYQIVYSSFWIISGVLLLINFMDLYVIFSGELPEKITYSEYIHQGFNTLIFTLSLSIGLILYFFRGQVNFYKKINALRKISYFWILQNLILVFITGYKNYMYVFVYGLTYKRIFVFICLVFVLIGLILSFDKVKRISANWLYFNKLARCTFISIVIFSIIPFDLLISNYNIKYSNRTDISYLLGLKNPDCYLIKLEIQKNETLKKKFLEIIEKKIYKKENASRTASWLSWSFYSDSYKN